MIKINIKLPLDYTEETVKEKLSKALKVNINQIKSFDLLKLSVDARDKENIFFNASYSVEIDASEQKILSKNKNASKYEPFLYVIEKNVKSDIRPIVVGTGPAGLFCAYILANAGLKPIVIERGEMVSDRIKSVEGFWNGQKLNTESNVQFGEGGAGTFSDGKLNTGISDKRIPFVLKTFYECGAPKEILWRQKPHIGTDKLREVVVNLRKKIVLLGGEFHFNCRLDEVNIKNNEIESIIVTENGEQKEIACKIVILALGHSARDTFESLYKKGLKMIQKPFAIGARIEHTQEFINKSQYGKFANHPSLPTADYKLAVHLENGRGVYSFCMCPGGYVVNASSEEKMIAVNGMSNFKRDGENANSALLVNVTPKDFGSDYALAGIEFQRKIEMNAYNISGSYKAPCETVGTLLGEYTPISKVKPTANVCECDLGSVLPSFVVNSLKEGIVLMDKKIKGFADKSAVLTGPETRSSSPVRILRDENCEADIKGIYPCGEGAGYAGGITSAATDGIRVAEKIIEKLKGDIK